jgi:hypothetical protein
MAERIASAVLGAGSFILGTAVLFKSFTYTVDGG